MPVLTLKHGVVELESGTGAASRITLGPGGGDLSIDGLNAGQVEEVVIEDRLEFLELAVGKQTYPTGTLNIFSDGKLTHSTERRPLDAILQTGGFTSDSLLDPGGVVWTSKIIYTGTRGLLFIRIELPNCRIRSGYSEAAEGNKIPFNFTSYGRPTITSSS